MLTKYAENQDESGMTETSGSVFRMANRPGQSSNATLACWFYENRQIGVNNIDGQEHQSAGPQQSPTCWGTLVWRNFSSPGLDQLDLDFMEIGSKQQCGCWSWNLQWHVSGYNLFEFCPKNSGCLGSRRRYGPGEYVSFRAWPGVGWDVNVQVNRLTRDVNECIRDYVFAFVCRTNWGSANTLNKLAELAANCWCEKMSLFSKRVCNQLFLNVPINQLWRTQSHANTSENKWCCLIHKVEIL